MADIFNYGAGGPRIRLLAANGTTEVTLKLPAPDNGGISQSFDEAKSQDEMLDHSINVQIYGYWYKFKCKWSVYDETSTGLTVGIAEGNTPTVPQLQEIFTSYRPGRIQFSPSYTDAFYTVFFDSLPTVTPLADFATGYEFTVKTITLYTTANNNTAKVLS